MFPFIPHSPHANTNTGRELSAYRWTRSWFPFHGRPFFTPAHLLSLHKAQICPHKSNAVTHEVGPRPILLLYLIGSNTVPTGWQWNFPNNQSEVTSTLSISCLILRSFTVTTLTFLLLSLLRQLLYIWPPSAYPMPTFLTILTKFLLSFLSRNCKAEENHLYIHSHQLVISLSLSLEAESTNC